MKQFLFAFVIVLCTSQARAQMLGASSESVTQQCDANQNLQLQSSSGGAISYTDITTGAQIIYYINSKGKVYRYSKLFAFKESAKYYFDQLKEMGYTQYLQPYVYLNPSTGERLWLIMESNSPLGELYAVDVQYNPIKKQQHAGTNKR